MIKNFYFFFFFFILILFYCVFLHSRLEKKNQKYKHKKSN